MPQRGLSALRRTVVLSAVCAVSCVVAPAAARAVPTQALYWTDGDAIARASADGSSVDENFIKLNALPSGVAVDTHNTAVNTGYYIYWSTSTSIGRANLDGSGADENFITGLTGVEGIAADPFGGYLYWVSGLDPACSSGYGIGRANHDGTHINLGYICLSRAPSGGLASSGGALYWSWKAGLGGIGEASASGSPVDESFITDTIGAAPAGFLAGIPPAGVAVADAYVYWAMPNLGPVVGRANILDGSAQEPYFVTGPPGSASSVAADDRYIYWSAEYAGLYPPGTPPAYMIGRANSDGSGVNATFIAGLRAAGALTLGLATVPGGGWAPAPGKPPCTVKIDRRCPPWSIAQVQSYLQGQSGGSGRAPRIEHQRYALPFTAPVSCRVALSWLYQRGDGHGILVARGQRTFATAGRGSVTLTFTPAGVRLLAHPRGHLRLTAEGIFTRRAAVPLSTTTNFVWSG